MMDESEVTASTEHLLNGVANGNRIVRNSAKLASSKQRKCLFSALLVLTVACIFVAWKARDILEAYGNRKNGFSRPQPAPEGSIPVPTAGDDSSEDASSDLFGSRHFIIRKTSKASYFSGREVITGADNFTDRVRQFEAALGKIREHLLRQPAARKPVSPGGNLSREITVEEPSTNVLEVIWGFRDDYLEALKAFPKVTTVVLPWSWNSNYGNANGKAALMWDSRSDFSNVLFQDHVEWTADDKLCSWIEIPNAIPLRYDAVFSRTCHRSIAWNASIVSLQPIYFNRKPVGLYQLPDGNLYPNHFYTEPPPFVLYLHVIRDVIVTELGDVFSGNLKLVLYACQHTTNAGLPLAGKLDSLPTFDEIFVVNQPWGELYYNRLVEVLPRLVFYLHFLKANPKIKISSPSPQTGSSSFAELLRIVGLDPRRLVSGQARAKLVYLPRSTQCDFPNVQESQASAAIYRDYIRKTFPAQPRKRLVMIHNSRNGSFSDWKGVEKVIERVAADFNLTFTLFSDEATPPLNEAMQVFHSAVMVVAPPGAALTNLLFSRPGTFVLEGICEPPSTNLRYQQLAHIIGHRWHGLAATAGKTGCPDVVNIPAASVEKAARGLLASWLKLRVGSKDWN